MHRAGLCVGLSYVTYAMNTPEEPLVRGNREGLVVSASQSVQPPLVEFQWLVQYTQ